MRPVDEHISIPREVRTKDGFDFEFLLDEGRQYIEDLGRKLWTEYNPSDPGITILETLCYAITDLELRISQPIEDLITPVKNPVAAFDNQFHSAKNILTTAPVTALDYRKLFIDIIGVKNAWVLPYDLPIYVECKKTEKPEFSFHPIKETTNNTTSFTVKGLYSVLIDFNEDLLTEEYHKIDVLNKVYEAYHGNSEVGTEHDGNRNLCEDVAEIKVVPEKGVKVCAKIQIEESASEERIDAQIRFLIENYFSPSVHTYSLKELVDKGFSGEEIFNGPVLENGFILDEELEQSDLRSEVRLSDIMNLIMGIEGVKYIEDIEFMPCEEGDRGCSDSKITRRDAWIICIPKGCKPALCEESKLHFKKNFIPVHADPVIGDDFLKKLRGEERQRSQRVYEDFSMPIGHHYDNSNYLSIQNDLPRNYGVSEDGLPYKSSKSRKSQAKQLQAYLLFIDQVFATYFAELGGIADAFNGSDDLSSKYLSNEIEGIREINKLFKDYSKYKTDKDSDDDSLLETIFKKSEVGDFYKKRDVMLDHLLSRFGESFSSYAQIALKLSNTNDAEKIEANIRMLKKEFHKDLSRLSYRRGLAFSMDGVRPTDDGNIWNTDNVHGIVNRLKYELNIEDVSRRDLAPCCTDDKGKVCGVEGLFALESIMFLPTRRSNFTFDYIKYFKVIPAVGEIGKFLWKIVINGKKFTSNSQNTFDSEKLAINGFYENLKHLINPLQLGEEIDGDKQIYWMNDEGTVVAVSNPYDSEDAERYIKYLTKEIESDIMNFECLGYSFIDKNNDNLLLDPCALPCVDGQCFSKDPIDIFSYRMHFILPGRGEKFGNADFRAYVESKIYEHLPAHILPRICWVECHEPSSDDKSDMGVLQVVWREYLEWKMDPYKDSADYKELASKLLCSLNKQNTIYGSGCLHNCEDDQNKKGNKIILNRTTLGTLKN